MAELPDFRITDDLLDNLTWDDLITLQRMQRGEDLTTNLEAVKDLCVPFVTDSEGRALSEEAARQALGRLKRKDIPIVLQRFTTTLAEYAVPKQTGNPLMPSTEGMAPAPDGFTPS